VAVLDGGWWPRSWDPLAELPGFVLALGQRYGAIRELMLNRIVWAGGFRRLVMTGRTIRMGWFPGLDRALAIATTQSGDQLDLLVVPPGVPADTANNAMTIAADPRNAVRAPALLAGRAAVAGGRSLPDSAGRPALSA
jgi:hypothetical protein